MAEFKKLSEVEQVETVSENATVLVEEGGDIKRVPKTEVGGAGIKIAIIKDSGYDKALTGVSSDEPLTYECTNMTFEQMRQIIMSGELLIVIGQLTIEQLPTTAYGEHTITDAAFGVPSIGFAFDSYGVVLAMDADGSFHSMSQ